MRRVATISDDTEAEGPGRRWACGSRAARSDSDGCGIRRSRELPVRHRPVAGAFDSLRQPFAQDVDAVHDTGRQLCRGGTGELRSEDVALLGDEVGPLQGRAIERHGLDAGNARAVDRHDGPVVVSAGRIIESARQGSDGSKVQIIEDARYRAHTGRLAIATMRQHCKHGASARRCMSRFSIEPVSSQHEEPPAPHEGSDRSRGACPERAIRWRGT